MSIPTVINITPTAFRSTPNFIINEDNNNININNNNNNNNDNGVNGATTSTTIYYSIATVLSLILVIGVFFNSMAILIFVKSKELRTPTNSFVMTLCICDLFMCVLGMPIPIVKAWQQSPIRNPILCVFDGFIVYFLGLSSMYILVAISVDRYVVIVRPLKSLVVTQRMALLSIGLCFGLGLFWTVMPLLGWNRFVLEGIGVSCSISWRSLEPVATSYIFTIFVFCLLLPVLVMALCYVNIYWVIRKVARHTPWGPNSHIAQNNHRLERKMLRTIVIMLGAFLLSWTPYAVVSMAQTFSGQVVMDPVTETFPALIAKMSAVWDPIIYIATNKQFRQAFFSAAPCCKVCPCVCLGENQSEGSDTMQDESGAVLDELRCFRPKSLCGQSLELSSQKTDQNTLSGVSLKGFPLDMKGTPESVTMALLVEDGTVVCELAEKAVEMLTPED